MIFKKFLLLLYGFNNFPVLAPHINNSKVITLSSQCKGTNVKGEKMAKMSLGTNKNNPGNVKRWITEVTFF
jgi:hypothetical protein